MSSRTSTPMTHYFRNTEGTMARTGTSRTVLNTAQLDRLKDFSDERLATWKNNAHVMRQSEQAGAVHYEQRCRQLGQIVAGVSNPTWNALAESTREEYISQAWTEYVNS